MVAAFDSLDTLNHYESAFVNAVLAYHGIAESPSLEVFTAALRVLQRYALQVQVQDNPRDESRESWAQRMNVADVAAIDARAFLLFGATKPTADQWRRVHREIYGPLLCDNCE